MNILADALNSINNAEKRGKCQVMFRRWALSKAMLQKTVLRFLTMMMKHTYISEFEITDGHRPGNVVVNLRAG
uniref:40S ribosomal protein S15a n=1 Tax=Neovison vison TaxID=452646 RepID=A0A8C7BGC6_NEOVI